VGEAGEKGEAGEAGGKEGKEEKKEKENWRGVERRRGGEGEGEVVKKSEHD
jgi:hypothetical protein